jgi:thioredoxin 1
MNPIIEDVEKEYAGKLKISKVDVDQNQDKAAQFGVMSIPTYIVLKNGKEVDRKVGALTKDKFKTWLDSSLSK